VAAAATRFVIGGTDPVTLGAFRFGLGFLFLLPIALARPRRWPRGRDWSAVLALGLLFFAVFFVLFNVSLRHTTAARGGPGALDASAGDHGGRRGARRRAADRRARRRAS
jgi:drug/metabolite transporter (DMT)-like permease